jgi:hypothetical protein
MSSIVQSDKNVSVWLLTNETGVERYITLHGELDFISNPINAITAAQEKWEGQAFPSFQMICNSVACFEATE